MARLVKYVVAAQGGLDPRSWSRTADYMLDSGTSSRGEKVGGVRVTNCYTDDPAAATTLIEATQRANTTSKSDKTYHLMFAFPPGENPDLKTLHKIEDELCAAIGYADHQRISAIHIDTDHLHVHVAINKVRKIGKNYNNIEPWYDQNKLMETCERLEIEHGLTRTNHGLTGEKKREKDHTKLLKDNRKHNGIHSDQTHDGAGPNKWSRNSKRGSGAATTIPRGKAADAEAHSGIESLQGFVPRDLAPRLKQAKTWKEAHSILAEHGLEIKQRGAGLVIGSGDLWVKASQCDRALSFKAMTDRLGPIEKGLKPAKPYEPKPRQQHPSSAILFEQYQSEKLRTHLAREKGLMQLKYESDLLEYQLKKWTVAQRTIIKITPKGPKRRAMLKVITLQAQLMRARNWKAADAKRKELFSLTTSPGWVSWLAQQAESGNTEALSVLRSRQEREKMQGDYLTADNAAHVVAQHLKPIIDRKGAITYTASDGGLVIDRSNHIQCYRTSAKASLMALELATERFKGQTLIIEGQESFQKEIARLAAERGISVRFASPTITRSKSKDKEMEL